VNATVKEKRSLFALPGVLLAIALLSRTPSSGQSASSLFVVLAIVSIALSVAHKSVHITQFARILWAFACLAFCLSGSPTRVNVIFPGLDFGLAALLLLLLYLLVFHYKDVLTTLKQYHFTFPALILLFISFVIYAILRTNYPTSLRENASLYENIWTALFLAIPAIILFPGTRKAAFILLALLLIRVCVGVL
jgi:hypothetical protein